MFYRSSGRNLSLKEMETSQAEIDVFEFSDVVRKEPLSERDGNNFTFKPLRISSIWVRKEPLSERDGNVSQLY